MEVNRYYCPTTLEEARQILAQDPKNVLLGGGLWLKKSTPIANTIVDLSHLGLNQIVDLGDQIEVGAMVSLRDMELNPLLSNIQNGILNDAIGQVMGVAFRNGATIGGSIAGRFPFSDVITPLLALDVKLRFYPHKEISLEEFLNYKGRVSDILTHILIAKTKGPSYFKKVKTTALDFAILNVAISKIDGKYRIAIGSRPSVAALAIKSMDIVNNATELTKKEIEESALASNELLYATTTSASAEYRKTLAKAYVRRGLEEVNK